MELISLTLIFFLWRRVKKLEAQLQEVPVNTPPQSTAPPKVATKPNIKEVHKSRGSGTKSDPLRVSPEEYRKMVGLS